MNTVGMQYPKLSKAQHNQALHRHNENSLNVLYAKHNNHVLVVLEPHLLIGKLSRLLLEILPDIMVSLYVTLHRFAWLSDSPT